MVREGRRRGGKRLFNSCCWNCTVAEEDEAQLRRWLCVIVNDQLDKSQKIWRGCMAAEKLRFEYVEQLQLDAHVK